MVNIHIVVIGKSWPRKVFLMLIPERSTTPISAHGSVTAALTTAPKG